MLDIIDRIGASLTGEGAAWRGAFRETQLDRLSEGLPYRLYDSEKQLFLNASSVGWVIELVPLLGANEAIIKNIVESLDESVPDHSEMQIMSWASPRVGPVLDRWAQARFGKNDVLEKVALHRVSHLGSGAYDSLSDHANFMVRRFRSLISLGMKGDDEERRKELVRARNVLQQTLKSQNIHTRILDAAGLIRHVDDVLNPRRVVGKSDLMYDPAELIDRQIVRPDTFVQVERDKLLFETTSPDDPSPFAPPGSRGLIDYVKHEHDVRTFTVTKFPDRFHQGQMTEAIGHLENNQLRLPCPVLSTLCISFDGREAGRDMVGAKFARAEQQAGTSYARYMPEIVDKAADWKWARAQVQDGRRIVQAGYYVTAFAPAGAGDECSKAIQSIYKSMNWTLARDQFVCIQTLMACLPLTTADGLGDDLRKLKRMRNMISPTTVNIAPLQGEFVGSDHPDLLLIGRRGQPFFWSPFQNKGEGNHNVAVIGGSGSGKSVAMEELAIGMYGAGAAMCIIDDGESFKHPCFALGGTHMKFTLQSHINVCPFPIIDDERAGLDSDYKADSLLLVRAMIEQMAFGDERANKEEQGLIDAAVTGVFEEQGSKGTIDDVVDAMRAQEHDRANFIANALRPYTSNGIYGPFFTGTNCLSIDGDFTVFEMKDLESKKELRSVVMLAVMFIVNQRMMRDRSERMGLVIDEAWAMLGKGAAGEFIEGFARRCRKYGGSLITGTQGIGDYYRTEGAQAAFENSEWVIVLKLKAEKVHQMMENQQLALDEQTGDKIRSLTMSAGEYSEMLIMGPHGKHIGRLALDKFSVTLFSTDSDVFGRIDNLVEQGLSMEQAVEMEAFGQISDQEGVRHAAE